MAKPNYSFEKRQRDLEKKRKQEEKRLRKLAAKQGTGAAGDGEADESAEPAETGLADEADGTVPAGD